MATKKQQAKIKNGYIYGLFDQDTLLYVGSTDCIGTRYKRHTEHLQAHKHTNKTLQKYCDNHHIIPTVTTLHKTKDNSRIRKWIAEMILIDILRPKCNRPILQTSFGRYTNIGYPEIPFESDILQYL